ncbi:CAMK family protein kinase [Trichomonas vaginalis G3]|uniref:CAMK family protein kinase n=1 Tax=Trichomonas vaginalis (strain ATCC PRA-98 / G3) TaxID=412133 RepID=A2DXR1_TRIV3|nr:protein serine/threonine kinase protein [Trichomonas vaginalis G3]EAY14771.1 CAMK family protein kinase [Trichomonas vaginalis G3]KAI5508045.1 protein serine/threonine kinase protein [Trichomonas vaginalis G3]|eukprot:XP_001326994.1 CAMK family protein kinase [Trichomonas vaginalis G3]
MNTSDRNYMKFRNLQLKEVIGNGQSGVVYLVNDPKYRRDFALKSVPLTMFHPSGAECMMNIDDPNVIRLYKFEPFESAAYLLEEYCPNSLDSALKKRGSFENDLLLHYADGILKGIRALHQLRIAHLDIKPANFLIDTFSRVRVCDFGISNKFESNELCTKFGGSVPFMSPEILQLQPFDPFKADIWAIGVTFFIIATGVLPWEG